MSKDSECEKCGRYSGGGLLCVMCEKAAVKRNARKPRKKKADPIVVELMAAVLEGIPEDCEDDDDCRHCRWMSLLDRAKERFK